MRAGGKIATGTEVEVRNRFTGEWSVGFEVVGSANGAVQVRRLRDGAIIPTPFREEEVRICATAKTAPDALLGGVQASPGGSWRGGEEVQEREGSS